MTLKTAFLAAVRTFMFGEGHIKSGVFNAPNQTTTATYNLAIPTDKLTTTRQAKLQRKS
jgi:hypothetical protein